MSLGSVRGFGRSLLRLPGEWPDALGSTEHTITWATCDAVFDPSGDWWFRETPAGLDIRFLDEGLYGIVVDPEPHVSVVLGPATEREAALSFVLAVLPLSLPLFGLEPFHGAALELSTGSALMVMGHPEAGKSTTTAALRAQGLRFLADDACAIDHEGLLWPGPPLLSARSVRPGDTAFASYDGKTVVAIEDHDLSPLPVGAGVILRPEEAVPLEVTQLEGKAAIKALLEQVRSPWVMPERRRVPQFHAAATVAQHPIATVSYDKAVHAPDDVAQAIIGWASGLA